MIICGAIGARLGAERRIGANKGFAVGCLLAPFGPLLVLMSRGGSPLVPPLPTARDAEGSTPNDEDFA
jgi:hypothetical protein